MFEMSIGEISYICVGAKKTFRNDGNSYKKSLLCCRKILLNGIDCVVYLPNQIKLC